MFYHRNVNGFLSLKCFRFIRAVLERESLVFESVDMRTFLSFFNTDYFFDMCYSLTPQVFVFVI